MKALLIALLALAHFLSLSACPGPQPVPTPIGPVADASPVDAPLPIPAFDHKVFDCRADVVKAEYQVAKPAIKTCLSSSSAPDCLAGKVGTYDAATVSCLARDLGADANAAMLVGSTDPADALAASAARIFINSQHLGYR